MPRRIGAAALALLFLTATTQVRAEGVRFLAVEGSQPGALFSLEVFVRHRRAARVTVAVGMAAGLTCAALSLARLYGDCARFAVDAVPAVTVRRDVLALSASTALLSLFALAFDALAPAPAPTSRE